MATNISPHKLIQKFDKYQFLLKISGWKEKQSFQCQQTLADVSTCHRVIERTLITPSEQPNAAIGPSTTPDRGRNATLQCSIKYYKTTIQLTLHANYTVGCTSCYQRGDLLSNVVLGTSRARMLTKSRNITLFSQHTTKKCRPLIVMWPPPVAGCWLPAVIESSPAAVRLIHACQYRTSSS